MCLFAAHVAHEVKLELHIVHKLLEQLARVVLVGQQVGDERRERSPIAIALLFDVLQVLIMSKMTVRSYAACSSGMGWRIGIDYL